MFFTVLSTICEILVPFVIYSSSPWLSTPSTLREFAEIDNPCEQVWTIYHNTVCM